jgi:hypothetical protein
MKSFLILSVAASLALAQAAIAGVIADYRGDYVFGTVDGQTRASVRADGWNYLWNPQNQPIGTASGYQPLGVLLSRDGYVPEGVWVSGGYGGYMEIRRLNQTTGAEERPGLNYNGSVCYTIAAYTIQAANAGEVWINNGTLATTNNDGGDLDLRVYVGDALKFSQNVTYATPYAFTNYSLGSLTAGQVVYVAVGSSTPGVYATYDLGFQLVPEPGALALLLAAGGLAGWRRRPRR